MTERTSVTQIVQVGVETTPGTTVAATRKFQAINLDTAIKTNVDVFRPAGYKFPTVTAQGKEWMEANITGEATYNELPYLFSSLLSYAAPTQQGTSLAYSWTFSPNTTTEDTVKTYTIEQGSANRAHKFGYGIVTGLNLALTRDKLGMTGTMMGQLLSDGITLTAGTAVSAVALVPVMPVECSAFLDLSAVDLGNSQELRVLAMELDIPNRFAPLWTIDATQSSWAAKIEVPIQSKLKMTMEANSDGMALLTYLRANTSIFARMKFTSAVSAGSSGGTNYPYSMTIDVAAKITNVNPFKDDAGIYAIEWDADVIHDNTWGKAMSITIVNVLSAL